jgi:hypothetical protein
MAQTVTVSTTKATIMGAGSEETQKKRFFDV